MAFVVDFLLLKSSIIIAFTMLLQKQFFIMYIYSFRIFGNHTICPGANERDTESNGGMQMSFNMNPLRCCAMPQKPVSIEYIDNFNERQWQPKELNKKNVCLRNTMATYGIEDLFLGDKCCCFLY